MRPRTICGGVAAVVLLITAQTSTRAAPLCGPSVCRAPSAEPVVHQIKRKRKSEENSGCCSTCLCSPGGTADYNRPPSDSDFAGSPMSTHENLRPDPNATLGPMSTHENLRPDADLQPLTAAPAPGGLFGPLSTPENLRPNPNLLPPAAAPASLPDAFAGAPLSTPENRRPDVDFNPFTTAPAQQPPALPSKLPDLWPGLNPPPPARPAN